MANVLLNRGDRETAIELLDRLKDKHFKGGAVTGGETSITRSGGRDLEIETTAIAMLGWLRANDPKYATTIKEATKWISQQRGGYGGFGSTQSTILALKALILYAKKSAHPAEAGEIKLLVGGKAVGTPEIHREGHRGHRARHRQAGEAFPRRRRRPRSRSLPTRSRRIRSP